MAASFSPHVNRRPVKRPLSSLSSSLSSPAQLGVTGDGESWWWREGRSRRQKVARVPAGTTNMTSSAVRGVRPIAVKAAKEPEPENITSKIKIEREK